MSTLDMDHRHTSRSVSVAHIFDVTRAAGRLLAAWSARAARRRQMRDLLRRDDRLLADVGVRREDVMHEAFKAFWRE